MARLSSVQAAAALLVLAVAHAAYAQLLMDPAKFGNPNATFERLNFQSYSNLTLDACYIKDVSLASPKTPNTAEAMDIYGNGKFAFRLNVTTQELSARKRIILPFAGNTFNEVWFKQYAKYYTGNETKSFLADWINGTLDGTKYFTTSAAVSNTAAKTLIMTVPIYYMFHEVDAGFRGFKDNNATTGAVAEITDAFFVFYGPKKSSCSMPVFQQKAARSLCTLNKRKVSVHLEALESAFVQLLAAVKLGNTTKGIAAYEAGRQSMFKAVTYSQLQLILTSALKASKVKAGDLESYRTWITEARVWLLTVEPYIFDKSPAAARRLVSIFNPTTTSIRKNLMAQVKAAMLPYLTAMGANWKTVWGC